MYRRSLCLVALVAMSGTAAELPSAEREVRVLMDQWDAAYRSLDAGALTALETPDFELINRLGQWTPMTSRAENERMWAWGFANIYRGKPGPRHTVERVRFAHPDVAIVQTRAFWPALKLENGMDIPPHGEIATFVVVKKPEGWRIASENIHNQMPGDDLPSELPWNTQNSQGAK